MLPDEGGFEAMMIDGAGRTLEPTSAAATVAALSGIPLGVWLGLVGFLFGFAFCVPLLLARTVKALRLLDDAPPRPDQLDARGVFFGALHLPPGAMLVGAVEHDTAGGPMRATHRRALGPDRALHFIGRGGPTDFERHLSAFENARLIRFAFCQLAIALGVLLALGLRPFA